MITRMKSSWLLTGLLALGLAASSPAMAKAFDVTILGAHGGLDDGNLSAYLLREEGAQTGVLLDAGTVLNGVDKADQAHAFVSIAGAGTLGYARSGRIVHQVIQGYLLSHAHLDHVAGLVAISPDDPGKPLYALPSVNAVLQEDLFNHRVWPNLGDRGVKPALGLLHYHDLIPGQSMALAHTALSVEAYPLSHGGVESTAFLLHSGQDALLYLGDTGPDALEAGHRLEALWSHVAPLIRTHRLRGIIIECSYDNSRPDTQLYGHLTPRWLLAELVALRASAGVSMRGFPILVAHIKPRLSEGKSAEALIGEELRAGNDEGYAFTIARQGAVWRP